MQFTCYKVHPFKVFKSMKFGIFTDTCNHHKEKTVYISHLLFLPSPYTHPWIATNLFSVSLLPILDISYKGFILAWRIPWTEEPGGLQSMWSQRVRHNWVTNTFRAFQEVIKVTWVICMRPWSNKIDIPIRGRNSKNVHTQRKTHLRTQSEGIYHPAP